VGNASAIAQSIASANNICVIQIDSEKMLVTAVNVSTNTLTVTRGYSGTAAAAHSANAGVGFANDEIGLARINGRGQTNIGAHTLKASATFSVQPPATVAVGASFSVNVTFTTSPNGHAVPSAPLVLNISAGTLQGNTTGTTNASGVAGFGG